MLPSSSSFMRACVCVCVVWQISSSSPLRKFKLFQAIEASESSLSHLEKVKTGDTKSKTHDKENKRKIIK